MKSYLSLTRLLLDKCVHTAFIKSFTLKGFIINNFLRNLEKKNLFDLV